MRTKLTGLLAAAALALAPQAAMAGSASKLSLSPEVRAGAPMTGAQNLEGAGEVALGVGVAVAVVALWLLITDEVGDDDPSSP